MYNVVVDMMVRQIVNIHLVFDFIFAGMLKGTPTHIPQGFCPVKLRSSREHFVWETNDSLCKLMLQRPRNDVVCSGAIHDECTSRAARRNNESPAKNLCKWRYLVKKAQPFNRFVLLEET